MSSSQVEGEQTHLPRRTYQAGMFKSLTLRTPFNLIPTIELKQMSRYELP